MRVVAYVDAGDFICVECTRKRYGDTLPDDLGLVFSDSETDTPTHCSECGMVIDETLTDYGEKYVIDAYHDLIAGKGGSAWVIDEWLSTWPYLRKRLLEEDKGEQEPVYCHYCGARCADEETCALHVAKEH